MDISLYSAISGIIVIPAFVLLRHWAQDYLRPEWRVYRWQEFQEHRVIHYSPLWDTWFAWRPVRTVSGEIVWWQEIYRTIGNDYVDHDDFRWYHYGDIMDVLRDSK